MTYALARWAPVLLALSLGGCGGGGAADALPGELPDPLPSTDLVENLAIYTDPGTSLVDMFVTIRAADNPESEEDTDCPFVDPMDGVGTTLDDVHQDLDGSDNCKPELNIVLEVDGLVDSLGAVNAEMRMRGSSSRFANQKSYRIKLKSKAEGDLWRGQRTLQVAKQPFDLTRLRNKLSFDLFIDIPHITSLRTQFLRLFVDQQDGNGAVDFGLYTQIEKVDEYFLQSHGLDPEGTVYKAEFFEFERYADNLKVESDPSFDEDAFEQILEIEEGDGDHAPLLAMLDALNDESNDFNQVLATYFNEQNYLTWLACNILFNNLDTNSQNFFLYRKSDASIFYFLPWDYDGAWDFYGQPVELQNDHLGRWQRGIPNWWGTIIAQRYFKLPGSAARLTAKLQEIKNTYVTQARVQMLIDSYIATVRGQASIQPDIDHLPALDDATEAGILAEYDAEVARLPALVEKNYQDYLDALERPMPVYMGATPQGGNILFTWDRSFDLQGDGLTYDFALSTTPDFQSGTIVAESLSQVDTSFEMSAAMLASGDYFYRVIVRDTKNPSQHWQSAFDTYRDATDTPYHGVGHLIVP